MTRRTTVAWGAGLLFSTCAITTASTVVAVGNLAGADDSHGAVALPVPFTSSLPMSIAAAPAVGSGLRSADKGNLVGASHDAPVAAPAHGGLVVSVSGLGGVPGTSGSNADGAGPVSAAQRPPDAVGVRRAAAAARVPTSGAGRASAAPVSPVPAPVVAPLASPTRAVPAAPWSPVAGWAAERPPTPPLQCWPTPVATAPAQREAHWRAAVRAARVQAHAAQILAAVEAGEHGTNTRLRGQLALLGPSA